MNDIYVIQDENYEAVAATFSQQNAIKYCRMNPKFSYREIPYINSEEFALKVIGQNV